MALNSDTMLFVDLEDPPFAAVSRLCLSEIKHVHTDDGVRQEMA
jgi:hypothetical protein